MGWTSCHFISFALATGFRRMNHCALRQVEMKPKVLGAASVLHALFEGDFCTINAWAANGISKRNTDGVLVLDLLSRDGFINRRENPEDGRFCLIHLTTKGIRFRPCQCQTRNEAFRQPRSSRRMRVTPPQTKGSNRMKHGKITQTDRF